MFLSQERSVPSSVTEVTGVTGISRGANWQIAKRISQSGARGCSGIVSETSISILVIDYGDDDTPRLSKTQG